MIIKPENKGTMFARERTVIYKKDGITIYESYYVPYVEDFDLADIEPRLGRVYLVEVGESNPYLVLDTVGEYFVDKDVDLYNEYSEAYDKVTPGFWFTNFDRNFVERLEVESFKDLIDCLVELGNEILEG